MDPVGGGSQEEACRLVPQTVLVETKVPSSFCLPHRGDRAVLPVRSLAIETWLLSFRSPSCHLGKAPVWVVVGDYWTHVAWGELERCDLEPPTPAPIQSSLWGMG